MHHYIAVIRGRAILATVNHKGKIVKAPSARDLVGKPVGYVRVYCRRNGWPFYEVSATWL